MYEIYISVASLCVTIILLTLQRVYSFGGIVKTIESQGNAITDLKADMVIVKGLCTKVVELETKIQPFWHLIDKSLPDILKGRSGRTDQLLLKFQSGHLIDNERWELIDALTDKYRDTTDIGIKMAALLMIERLKLETAAQKTVSEDPCLIPSRL